MRRLVAALLRGGLVPRLGESNKKQFTMMEYPNRRHDISQGQGTTRHLFELLTNYLETNLPATPTR